MSAKIWYLAVGQKKVGPVSQEDVLERIASGKLPDKTVVWRDGMAGWVGIREVPEFEQGFAALEAPEPEPAAEPEPEPAPAPAPAAKAAPQPAAKKAAPKPKPAAAAASADDGGDDAAKKKNALLEFFFPSSVNLSFEQPFRVGWKDVFRGFGLGMVLPRLKIVLMVGAIAAGMLLVFGGIAVGAMQISGGATWGMILAAPFVLVLVLGLVILSSAGMGALSYATRKQLVDGSCPGPKEALGYARQNLMALVLSPLAIFGLALAGILLLLILNIASLIPFVGPLLTGLIFIVHLAIGALVFFLMVTFYFAMFMGPVIIGFEGSGVKDTMQILFDYVKRSAVRFVLYGILPSFVFELFTMLVVAVGAGMVAVPVAVTTPFQSWYIDIALSIGGLGTLAYGTYLAMFWLAVCAIVLLGLLASVANALISLLYLAGRKGNDELVDHNTYLARRAGTAA